MFISENAKKKIIMYYKEQGQQYIQSADKNILSALKSYEIDTYHIHPYESINTILFCESKKYGSCVLKSQVPEQEFFTQIKTLEFYRGNQMCKLYEKNIHTGIVLLEKIGVGEVLWEEKDVYKRAEKFSDVIKDFHVETKDTFFPSFMTWIDNIISSMEKNTVFYNYILKAKDMYKIIKETYNKSYVLHGDLHHENLIKQGDTYKIIDPKGIVDDKIFEIPRFILNEVVRNFNNEDLYVTINNIIAILSEKLGYEKSFVAKTLFIDTVISSCWSLSGEVSPAKYQLLIKRCEFAESLL